MDELKKILNKKEDKLKPIYLIYGEESFLLEKFMSGFINHFVSEEMKDFNLSFIDEEQNFFAKLKNMVNTLPVMAKKRYVIANCENHFAKKNNDDKVFIDLIENFPETTILLIIVKGNIDKRIKINNRLKKIGEIIQLNPPKYKNLDKWIKDQFAKNQKKVDNRSVKLLEEMFNNNLQRLEAEIEKIVTYCSDQKSVTYNDIKKIISMDRLLEDNIVFSFVDALSEKKTGKALSIYNQMVRAGEFPLKILGNIIWQVKLLLLVKSLKNKGQNAQQIAKTLKQHPYPVKKSYYRCDNFTEKELETVLERFLQANLEMVIGRYKDEKVALEMALLDI